MELYQILGWLNVWVFVILIIRTPLKILNKKLKNKKLMKVILFLTKYHRYLGIFMIVVAITHAYLLGSLFRFHSGTLILIAIITTAILGLLIRAKYNETLLKIHKILAIIILLLIMNHVYLRIF